MKQGKKVKFKALAIRQPDQTTALRNKINVVMDSPENETVTGKNLHLSCLFEINNSLSFFHLKMSSLPFHFEKLYTRLTWNNLNFDMLCITETTLKLSNTSLLSISLPRYNIEYATTESIKLYNQYKAVLSIYTIYIRKYFNLCKK